MVQLEPLAEAVGGELPGSISREAQSLGDRPAQQRIAERVQHHRKRTLGDMMFLMADGQLRNERLKRIEYRIESVAIAGEDHPSGEGAGAFAPERVEGLVDDVARIRLTGTRSFDRFGDVSRDGVGDGAGERPLKIGSGAEVME